MRVRVKILDPITAPFGTGYFDSDGNFLRWKYCRNINGKWYFETIQDFPEASK